MTERNSIHIQRHPVDMKEIVAKIKRKPIKVISKAGFSYGGWGHLPPQYITKPDVKLRDIPDGYKFLYCPYCLSWTFFKQHTDGEDKMYKCTGWCGWATTNEYYVKKYNNLFPQEMGRVTKTLKGGKKK